MPSRPSETSRDVWALPVPESLTTDRELRGSKPAAAVEIMSLILYDRWTSYAEQQAARRGQLLPTASQADAVQVEEEVPASLEASSEVGAEPEGSEPQSVGEALGPEPDAAEPDAAEPGAAEPGAAEPDAAEPAMPKPADAFARLMVSRQPLSRASSQAAHSRATSKRTNPSTSLSTRAARPRTQPRTQPDASLHANPAPSPAAAAAAAAFAGSGGRGTAAAADRRLVASGGVLCSADETASAAGGTLIVCPTSLLAQWCDEFALRAGAREGACGGAAGGVQLILYHGHGQQHTELPPSMSARIVVLTTYGTLAAEWAAAQGSSSATSAVHGGGGGASGGAISQGKRKFGSSEGGGSGGGSLLRTVWRRVVLDEAHEIRNHTSQTARAVFALRSERRWVVTGTPMQNSLSDSESKQGTRARGLT